ncbi:halo-CC-star protein HcsS [Halorubrum luteum]
MAAAEALGAELAAAQEESSPFQFTSILMQCNQAITNETGIDYGNACGAGGSC